MDIGEKGHSCTGPSRSGPVVTAQRRSSDPLDPETIPENGLKINFSVNTEGTYGGRGAGQPSPSGVSHVEFVGLGGDRQFTHLTRAVTAPAAEPLLRNNSIIVTRR